jgi:peptide-methionine (S)-S-oxide reductase
MAKRETATFGGGCFWCLEAVFDQTIGVEKAQSGYMGGRRENPTYEQVCTGATGHAEVVRVTFDAERISYGDLLDIFFAIHDPTQLNRQGNDVGTQYRSVIFYENEEQRAAAEAKLDELQPKFGGRIVTAIEPAKGFYAAEAYHEDYFARNPNQPYCRAVIDPKVRKFQKAFANRVRT